MSDYYVYILLDPTIEGNYDYVIDNNNIHLQYKPFYVGKGRRWRIGQHFCVHNLKKNTHKNNVIKNILK